MSGCLMHSIAHDQGQYETSIAGKFLQAPLQVHTNHVLQVQWSPLDVWNPNRNQLSLHTAHGPPCRGAMTTAVIEL